MNVEQGMLAQAAADARSRSACPENPLMLWSCLLDRFIEREILPRVIMRVGSRPAELARIGSGIEARNVAAFADLALAENFEAMRAMADQAIVRAGGHDALCEQLLAPAARLLGVMCDRGMCDSSEFASGLLRIDRIMKESAPRAFPCAGLGHSILLLAPGRRSGFGAHLTADLFRKEGWCVRSSPSVAPARLARLVRQEWFDVIGLSRGAGGRLQELPARIRAIRGASCNPAALVMVCGEALTPQEADSTGADAAAAAAEDALHMANCHLAAVVRTELPPVEAAPILRQTRG